MKIFPPFSIEKYYITYELSVRLGRLRVDGQKDCVFG